MKISSNNLFHFLKKPEWLLEIVKEMKISPRYVLEDYPSLNEKHLIQMKCFCDIPISSIETHINQYGKYGIGVTKDFAYRNYISPVFYYYKNSGTIFHYMSSYTREGEENGSILPYLKHIYDEKNEKYLYNEREWRYVNGRSINISGKSTEEILKFQEELNTNIKNAIVLYIEDIQYIFVNDEKDLPIFFDCINTLNISTLEKDLLKSKLITSRQIAEDF